MTETRLRVRAADVCIGDVLIGTSLHPTFIVSHLHDDGIIVRERRKSSSHLNRSGELISSKQIMLIKFLGRSEMCESRTIAADQIVSVIRK